VKEALPEDRRQGAGRPLADEALYFVKEPLPEGMTVGPTAPSGDTLYFSKEPQTLNPVRSAPRRSPPGTAPAPVIQRTALLQQPMPDTRAAAEPEREIQLQPPGPERLFKLESEAALQERWRQEERQQNFPPSAYPEEPILSTEAFRGRSFPPAAEIVEPAYVCYGRLHFEHINSERYGWELSILQPFISAAHFYWDVAWLPYHCGTEPCRKFDCDAGYCLPGDPVPLYLYPPELSATGFLAEAGTVTALFFIFPGPTPFFALPGSSGLPPIPITVGP
jgi:hypothetical protein